MVKWGQAIHWKKTEAAFFIKPACLPGIWVPSPCGFSYKSRILKFIVFKKKYLKVKKNYLCLYVCPPVWICVGTCRHLQRLDEGAGSPWAEVVACMAHLKSGPLEEQKLLITTEQCLHSLIWLSYCLYSFNLCVYMCWYALLRCAYLEATGHLWEVVLSSAVWAEGILTRPSRCGDKKLAELPQQSFYFFQDNVSYGLGRSYIFYGAKLTLNSWSFSFWLPSGGSAGSQLKDRVLISRLHGVPIKSLVSKSIKLQKQTSDECLKTQAEEIHTCACSPLGPC